MKTGLTVKRPRRVTIFSALVLLLGSGLNLARAVWALNGANRLPDLSTSMSTEYLSITCLLWVLVFGSSSIGLWRLRPWGRTLTLLAVTVYQAHIWFNHVLFDRSDYANQGWPFAVVHSLVVLAVAWGFLYWPSIRQHYGELTF